MDKEKLDALLWDIAFNEVMPKDMTVSGKTIYTRHNIAKSTYDYNKKAHRVEWMQIAREILNGEMDIKLRAALDKRLLTNLTKGRRLDQHEWAIIRDRLGMRDNGDGGDGGGKSEVLINLGELKTEDLEIKINSRLQETRRVNKNKPGGKA